MSRQCPRCGAAYQAAVRCANDGEVLATGADVLVGREVGPYRVDAPLAAGRSHRVYRAEDTRMKRTVALKVLHGELAADAALKKAYLYGASLAELRDPERFVQVLDARATDAGLVVVALELGEGRTLAEALAAGATFAADEVSRWGLSLVAGLHALHRRGRAHGAIEPRAIWLDEVDGVSRARWLDAGLGELGVVRADDAFRAPEAPRGPLAVPPLSAEGAPPSPQPTAAADVFALGAVLRSATGAGQTTLAALITAMTAREASARPAALEVAERLAAALSVPMPALGTLRPRRADSTRPRAADSTRPRAADSTRPRAADSARPRAAEGADPARGGEALPVPELVPSRRPVVLAVAAVGLVAALGAGWSVMRGRSEGGAGASPPVSVPLAVSPTPSGGLPDPALAGASPGGSPSADAPGSPDGALAETARGDGGAAVIAGRATDGGSSATDGRALADRATDGGASAVVERARRDGGAAAAAPRVVAASRPVDPGLIPPPPDPGMQRFDECDRQLGRALRDSGRSFADLETAAPDSARLWARWFKRADTPPLAQVESTCQALLAAASAP